MEDAGVGAERPLPAARLARVHQVEAPTQTRSAPFQHHARAAVGLGQRHDVVAGLHVGEERRRDRRHPRGEEQRHLRLFERRQPLLARAQRRVPEALVVGAGRPRFIGDVCLTLPALDAARAACPGARFAYVLERSCAPLLEGDPRVDELIVADPKGGAGAGAALAARLRRFAPDVAIDFFCNPRTALWTFLSGARARVGYPNKGWRSALYTHHSRPRTLSATGFHLASLAALGWPAPAGTPRLHLGEGARAEAAAALRALGVPDDATR